MILEESFFLNHVDKHVKVVRTPRFVSDGCFDRLVAILPGCVALEEFDFSMQSPDSKQVVRLASALHQCRSLRGLNLSLCDLTSAMLEDFLVTFIGEGDCPPLERLSLANMRRLDGQLPVVLINHLTSLTSLDLSDTGMREMLCLQSLHCLKLDFNKQLSFPDLNFPPTLTKLSLNGIGLSVAHFDRLLVAMEPCGPLASLASLGIGANKELGQPQIEQLLKRLPFLTRLRELEMCSLKSLGVSILIGLISYGKHLRRFDLRLSLTVLDCDDQRDVVESLQKRNEPLWYMGLEYSCLDACILAELLKVGLYYNNLEGMHLAGSANTLFCSACVSVVDAWTAQADLPVLFTAQSLMEASLLGSPNKFCFQTKERSFDGQETAVSHRQLFEQLQSTRQRNQLLARQRARATNTIRLCHNRSRKNNIYPLSEVDRFVLDQIINFV